VFFFFFFYVIRSIPISMPAAYNHLPLVRSFIGRLAALLFPFRDLLHREKAFAFFDR